MPNPNWRDRSADTLKQQIIRRPWGDRLTNSILVYHAGDSFTLDERTKMALIDGLFWHTSEEDRPKLEVFQLEAGRDQKEWFVLLHGCVILTPGLRVRDLTLTLFQVGHSADPAVINFEQWWPTRTAAPIVPGITPPTMEGPVPSQFTFD